MTQAVMHHVLPFVCFFYETLASSLVITCRFAYRIRHTWMLFNSVIKETSSDVRIKKKKIFYLHLKNPRPCRDPLLLDSAMHAFMLSKIIHIIYSKAHSGFLKCIPFCFTLKFIIVSRSNIVRAVFLLALFPCSNAELIYSTVTFKWVCRDRLKISNKGANGVETVFLKISFPL